MIYLQLIAGLMLLLVGGDLLVRGAVAVARRLGVSPLVIGLTLVGFGTSMPELMASLEAALRGSPGIAVGNVVGSNTANILLILGLSAIITPLPTPRAALYRDGLVLLAASLLLALLCLAGSIGRAAGLVMFCLLLAYVGYTYRAERTPSNPGPDLHRAEAEAVHHLPSALWLGVAAAVAGLAGIILGARVLVDAAIALARAAGVSETVVGLTLVAVGTSLPELATSLVAAVRRQPDIALGNIVGSNIFNTLGILGVTALVEPLAITAQIIAFDVWVMIAATLLLGLFAATDRRIDRPEGAVFLAGYGAYLVALLAPWAREGLGLAP